MSEPLDLNARMDFRLELMKHGLKQADVAQLMTGMDEPKMSRILNGRMAPPDGFAADFAAAVARLRPNPTPDAAELAGAVA
jgi:hypothetical protein